nr:aldehyde oxidase GLOX-like [Ipomoea batatas]
MFAAAAGGGRWELLLPNIGIAAMHMQLLNNDKVVMFDRTDFGLSNISLGGGRCRRDPYELVAKFDCTAHSVEYDVAENTVRPLMVQTDVWCSSASVMPDGTFVQTGGWNDGDHVVRVFKPCNDKKCDWVEIPGALHRWRWYATNHILLDGRQIIIGGREEFNYEFYPKTPGADLLYNLPFLAETNDPGAENNLYPYVFLNVDGNLFIFANNRAILYDYFKHAVVRLYPGIPGGEPRSYPSTGSAVLLPLKVFQGPGIVVEVLICGGAPKGAFPASEKGVFMGGLNSCGRIRINDPNPVWAMEAMPMARLMGDMVTLPTGDILIVNGAARGSAGYGDGRDPVQAPVLYHPDNPVGTRFEVLNPSGIPRMYHSSAILLRDSRVLVGGSNPHPNYVFGNALFPTELRLEAFSPPYLDPTTAGLRPHITFPGSHSKFGYGKLIEIQFTTAGPVDGNLVMVTMVAPSFTTHSFSQHQRLLDLGGGGTVKPVGINTYHMTAVTPNSGNLSPAGYYMLFVVHKGIPSEGLSSFIQIWVASYELDSFTSPSIWYEILLLCTYRKWLKSEHSSGKIDMFIFPDLSGLTELYHKFPVTRFIGANDNEDINGGIDIA